MARRGERAYWGKSVSDEQRSQVRRPAAKWPQIVFKQALRARNALVAGNTVGSATPDGAYNGLWIADNFPGPGTGAWAWGAGVALPSGVQHFLRGGNLGANICL